MKKIIVLVLLAVSAAGSLKAQSIQPDDIKAQMIKDWTRAKDYTGKYLSAMPADRYSTKIVDSIRTFAEQMLHLASANIFFGSLATGKPAIYSGFNIEKSPTAQSRDSVTFYVNASYDYMINSIQQMDPATLKEQAKMRTLSETRYALLLKAFEHQTHHRGQATIYIRLQGIRPPAEQLF